MDTDNTVSDAPKNPAPKKPYEKPTFRYEQVFVTTALSCGKIAGGSGRCHHAPSAS
jgi:hypothetical protein